MNESKANRILRLEQNQTASDQIKDYCGCRCHQKTIFDSYEISDKLSLEFVSILKSKKFKREDGTWTDEFEKLQERIENRPKCTCTCSH